MLAKQTHTSSLYYHSRLDKPQENVIYLSPDVSPKTQKLAVDPVEDCLQEVSFPGIFTVKQLQDVEHEGLVNVAFGQGGL